MNMTGVGSLLELNLPDDPAELTRAAIGELHNCEIDPAYTIEMGGWHSPVYPIAGFSKATCDVCLAGAIIATLNRPGEHLHPNNFPEATRDKLLALNWFRCGDISTGLLTLGYKIPAKIMRVVHVRSYHDTRQGFYEDIQDVIQILEENRPYERTDT